MRIVQISQLNITKIQEDGSFIPYPIWESEYFKALEAGDREIYDEYHKLLEKHHYKNPITETEEINYEEFIALYHDIITNGFNIQEPYINISEDNDVLDGQHRVSIIYHLSPVATLTVNEEGNVIKLWGQ